MLLFGSRGGISFIYFTQLSGALPAAFYTAARGAGRRGTAPGRGLRPGGDSGLRVADGPCPRAHRRAPRSVDSVLYRAAVQGACGKIFCSTAEAPRTCGGFEL